MKILAVESSAVTASAALFEDNVLLGSTLINAGLTHSQTLLSIVERLLSVTGVRPDEIDLFGVTNGPGSFTGVRIGVSLVKGMAAAGGKPCVGVSTLACIAEAFTASEGLVCAVMDARRQQVYHGLFRVQGGRVHRLSDDCALPVEELGKRLAAYGSEKIFLAGDGAELCARAFVGRENVLLSPPLLRHQNAVQVAQMAYTKYQNGEWASGEELVPSYLRPSQAERELAARQQKDV